MDRNSCAEAKTAGPSKVHGSTQLCTPPPSLFDIRTESSGVSWWSVFTLNIQHSYLSITVTTPLLTGD